jgi:heme/copper-type cytochrome/quinol oxidase subunit 4
MEQGTKKILGVNLGIFAAYTLLSFIMGYKDASGGVFHAFFIVSHVIISFLIGIIRLITVKENSDGGAFILSAGLILIIGFGTCVGITQLMETLTHKRFSLH